MLLFSRVVTLTANPRTTMPWAVGMTEYVNAHSSLDVSLWMYDFGQPLGTIAWSAVVESQPALVAASASLLADEGYYDKIEESADFGSSPGEDHLREFVHLPTGDGEPVGVGAVATLTTATALFDRIADALGWSVEIAEYVKGVTGSPVAVLMNSYGQMGEIAWIGLQPDQAAGEAARAKLAADTSYMAKMAATKELFVPGSGHVSHLTRIA
jgi:hypothetical protein